MKLIELFQTFNFHDGELVDLKINQDDIIISFSLPGFLQAEDVKELYKINNNGAKYLDLVAKFEKFSELVSDPLVNLGDIEYLYDYELWEIDERELKNQKLIIYLREYCTDNYLTISFMCQSVEVVSITTSC